MKIVKEDEEKNANNNSEEKNSVWDSHNSRAGSNQVKALLNNGRGEFISFLCYIQ